MEDRLKKFTDARRPEFETPPPPDLPGLWDNIADRLDQQERRSLWPRVWKVAAAVVLAIGLSWMLWPAMQPAPMAEWQEAQEYYQSQIDERLQMLQASSKGKIDPVVIENLAAVDMAIQELKEDLKDQANNEEVVNAMIQSYQLKLQLLEEILQQIQKNKEDETIQTPAA